MRPAPVFGMLKGEAVEQKDAEDAMEGRARVSKKACVAAGLFASRMKAER